MTRSAVGTEDTSILLEAWSLGRHLSVSSFADPTSAIRHRMCRTADSLKGCLFRTLGRYWDRKGTAGILLRRRRATHIAVLRWQRFA